MSVYCGRKDPEILLAIESIVYYAYSESLSLNWKIGKIKCLRTSPESDQLLGGFRKIL